MNGLVLDLLFRLFLGAQFADRIVGLKIKVLGGKMYILSVYAPCSRHDFVIRRSCFDVLSNFLRRLKCYGPKVLMGDFMHERLHDRLVKI